MAVEHGLADLEAYLADHRTPFSSPSSPDFASYQASFTGQHEESTPGIITRPQSAEQISLIVDKCAAGSVPLVLRGAGHDMFGRFTSAGAVSIDLRDLKGVSVSEDRKTAVVKGATTGMEVLKVLGEHGVVTPVGNCGWAGFIGWGLQGGIGPYTTRLGLGCDSIVAARVVNAEGELVEADEGMLKALRGGGGNVGIVTEVTVKTYPQKEIQAGFMAYECSDAKKTLTMFLTNYDKMLSSTADPMPQKLSLLPQIWNTPGQGLSMVCGVIWDRPASDPEMLPWIEKVARLALAQPDVQQAISSIKPMSAHDYASIYASFLPPSVIGRSQTASATQLTPSVIERLASSAHSLPSDATGGIGFHSIRPETPSITETSLASASVCPYREPMHVLEILGMGSDENSAETAAAWSLKTREMLTGLNGASNRTYLPLTAPEAVDLEAIYGEKLGELRVLKKKYDPKGVFSNALPRLV